MKRNIVPEGGKRERGSTRDKGQKIDSDVEPKRDPFIHLTGTY